ncbi:hypothetical protein NKH69_31040 [Mesorhizobium sp. M0976]|uniref:hypothetical protein n=1 Tax=unclassified Mesorhizobium TaxID=325217 RepID=UPI00333BD46A
MKRLSSGPEQSTESAVIHLAYSGEYPMEGGIREAPRALALGFGGILVAAVTG